MKRILAFFLAAVLACSMTACQDQREPDPTFPPGSNGPSKPLSEEEICTDHDLTAEQMELIRQILNNQT